MSKYTRIEAARSSARVAEDSGVPEPQTTEGGRQAVLGSPDHGRESEAVSSKVSPSTMAQAMKAARVLLEELDEVRTQTTAMEDVVLPNECIFPLPLPPCRNGEPGEACGHMIFGLIWPLVAGMDLCPPVTLRD